MNNATRHGISLHADVEIIESLIQRFTGPRYNMTEQEAIRCAAYAAIRKHNIPHDQAWEDSAEIARFWLTNNAIPST